MGRRHTRAHETSQRIPLAAVLAVLAMSTLVLVWGVAAGEGVGSGGPATGLDMRQDALGPDGGLSAGDVQTQGSEGSGDEPGAVPSEERAPQGKEYSAGAACDPRFDYSLKPLLEQGWSRSEQVPGDLEQVAASVLGSYRDGVPCVLAGEGYLDLLGSVWGCVIRGDGWAEVCVISEEEGGQECQVSVLRIDAEEMERLMAEEGEE